MTGIFKDGKLVLPRDRPDIQEQVKETRKAKRQRLITEKHRNQSLKRLEFIQNATRFVYVEVPIEDEETIDEIYDFMEKHNIPDRASDERNGKAMAEFALDDTSKTLGLVLGFLHTRKDKCKYDVYDV